MRSDLKIDSFQGKYRFLSNFYVTPIQMDGDIYPSVEHAYQTSKTLVQSERDAIRKCLKPGEAKRAGRKVTLRDDWEQVKISIMYHLLSQKFSWLMLANLLKGTGSAELIEGNTWGDTFWGVCRGKGENHLGKLLMRVRSEI